MLFIFSAYFITPGLWKLNSSCYVFFILTLESLNFFDRLKPRVRMNGFSVYYVTGLNALRHKLKELLILHQIAKLAPAII